jgi:hypothetical protein
MEVEIIVRRESKTKAEKYGHLINFEVVKFIIANIRRQNVITDEI